MEAFEIFNLEIGVYIFMKKIKSLFYLAAAFCATPANATFITVYDNLGSAYLAQGQSINGIFDLRAALPKANYQHYAINSAMLTFNLSDDADSYFLSNTVTGSYYNTSHYTSGMYYDSSKGWYYDVDYYQRNRTNYYFEQGETGSLSIGDQHVNRSDSDSYHHQNGPYYGAYTTTTNWVDIGDFCDERYLGYCTDWDPKYRVDENHYRTVDYDRYYNDYITGTTFTLSTLNTADLAQDGFLDFTFQATNGDLYFTEAYMTLDVEVIPEPPILALLGAGIAGIGFAPRRRKIQAKAARMK